MNFDVLGEASPEGCRLVDLECEGCATRTARDLASLCANLSATGIESAFLRMYPSSGCTPMLPAFAQAYFEATEPDLLPVLRLAASAAA